MHADPRLRNALLHGRRRRGVPGAGAPHPRRADGYEFAEVREYVAGDDPRRIDWAATARARTLQTRVMYEDHALLLAGALDASQSMFVGRTRSQYAIARTALETWYALASHDDRCVRICSTSVVSDARRRGHGAAMLCAQAEEPPGATFVSTLMVAAAATPRDASLLIVSDFHDLDGVTPLVRALAARCDLTALVVRDPWFDGLPLAGFVRMRDAETGEVRRMWIGAAERARFRRAVSARERIAVATLERLGARCAVLADDPAQALAQAFGLA